MLVGLLFLAHDVIHFLLSILLEIVFRSPLLLSLLNHDEVEVVVDEVEVEAEEVVELLVDEQLVLS